MKHTEQNEDAVSPIIGTILMVMITVVLAGVIAAFVFGTAGTIHNNKVVAVSVNQPESGKIVVTYMGGQDAQSFSYGTAIAYGDDGKDCKDYTNNTADNKKDGILGGSVGNTVTATGDFTGKNHIIVVGHFTDGSAQVLIDTYV